MSIRVPSKPPHPGGKMENKNLISLQLSTTRQPTMHPEIVLSIHRVHPALNSPAGLRATRGVLGRPSPGRAFG